MEGKRLFLLDADDLLNDWKKARSASFLDFKELWQGKDFSFIHEGRPKDLDRKAFLQTLYTACWEVIRGTKNSLTVQIGALYTIYLLHETQPGSYRQRVKVYASMEDLAALRTLMAAAWEQQLVDVARVANQMIQSGALLFGAVHNHLNADALRGPAAEVQRMRSRLLPKELLDGHFGSTLGDLLPLSKMDHDVRQYNNARKRLVAANPQESPHLKLAEDLLRTSAALERQVRLALNSSKIGKAPTRKPSRAPADVSRTGVSVPADVSRRVEPAATVPADVSIPPQVTSVPESLADVGPLPVQSMPSIPGLAGFCYESMEVDLPADAAEDGVQMDEREWEKHEPRALDIDDMGHEEPGPTVEATPDPVGRPADCAAVGNGEARTNFGHANGSRDCHLENGQRSNGKDKSTEVGHENGVLDRRRDGILSGENSSSDSDDSMEIRRPLPRALSPLL